MAAYTDYFLKDFTVPLSWYLDPPPPAPPPAISPWWGIPFSPQGSPMVYQYVYAGFFFVRPGTSYEEGTLEIDGTVESLPIWWYGEINHSWPGQGTPETPPMYYWPIGQHGYKPCYDLIACAGANDPAFPSAVPFGNQIGYGWLAYQKSGDPNHHIFYPRALGQRPATRTYASIIPLCSAVFVLFLPVLGTSLDAVVSATRRRYRNS